MEETIEYELVSIDFGVGYEAMGEESGTPLMACDSTDEGQPDNLVAFECDVDGVPMGMSKDESLARRKIIYDYIQKWRGEHGDNPRIYNENLKDYIKINQTFMLESVAHAAYSYRSTKAVLRMEEVMTKAKKFGETKAKDKNASQAHFQQMVVMHYETKDLGEIKMTVGIRKHTAEKVQYSITVPKPGTPLIDENMRMNSRTKKRKKHSK